MSWPWLLGACAAVYLVKLAGFLVPRELMNRPRVLRVAAATTVGLLASLTTVNTVADGTSLVVDARLLALGVAGVALLLRAPFLVVVVAGVVVAATARGLGLP